MAREAGIGDFECDCGHHSYFFENTIREMAALSLKRRKEVRLGSSEMPEHAVVFDRGAAVGIVCPHEPGVIKRFYPEATAPPSPRPSAPKAAPPRPPFTARQGQYLAFIHLYTKLNRLPPAETDFARYFRVTPPTVHQMIVGLERRGLIQRTPGRPRSIQLLVAPAELPELQDV